MYAADWFKMLLRRWYVLVPMLAITAAGCFLAARSVPPTYEAQATVLLLQPPDPDVEGPQNPYLRFGGGLPVIADVLGQTMAGDQAQASLLAQGARGTVIAGGAPGRSPMVVVTSEALTVNEAKRSLDIGLQTLHGILENLQQEAHAPKVTWVHEQLVARTDPQAPIRRAQIRAVIAVAAAGVILSVALTLAAEVLARSRRSFKRRSTRATSRQAPGRPPTASEEHAARRPEHSDTPDETLASRWP